MVVRLLEPDEAGRRFQAVLEASRKQKQQAAALLGVSAAGVTRLLKGQTVRGASSKEVSLKMQGVGYLATDSEAIWRFLEGEGPEDQPPLRPTLWLVEGSGQPDNSDLTVNVLALPDICGQLTIRSAA